MLRKMAQGSVGANLRRIVRLVALIAKNRGNEERVHSLRTETRRADIALRVFTGCLPPHRADWISRQLRKLRKKAGAVRDLHVLSTVMSFDQFSDEARHWFMKRMARSLAEEMRSLRRFCRRLLDREFDRRVRSFEKRIGWRHRSTPANRAEFCANAVNVFSMKFCDAVDLLKTDEQQLHEVRIRGRQLRYTLDLLRNVLPECAVQATCDTLSEIQDLLGQANDRISTLQYLRNCASEFDSLGVSIEQFISGLELETADQVKSAVRESIDKAAQVRSSVSALTYP